MYIPEIKTSAPGFETCREKPQRPLLNFASRGKLRPQGWTLSPGGEVIPWGLKFSVCLSILLNRRECSPPVWTKGLTFPLGDKFNPWGPSSPLGAKLRMAHRARRIPWNDCLRLAIQQSTLKQWSSSLKIRLILLADPVGYFFLFQSVEFFPFFVKSRKKLLLVVFF
jgi:hypothetical protein